MKVLIEKRECGPAHCRSRDCAGVSSGLLLAVIAIVGLGIAVGVLAAKNRGQAERLAELEGAQEELQALREEAAEVGRLRNQVAEVQRLRREAEEIHALRNEVRGLRRAKEERDQLVRENEQLKQGLAQLQRQRNDTGRLAQSAPPPLDQQGQETNAAGQEQEQGQDVVVEQQAKALCDAHLRLINAAVEQWALENRKPLGTVVDAEAVRDYLPEGEFPTCPAGGNYSLPPVGNLPTCNLPNHGIQQ